MGLDESLAVDALTDAGVEGLRGDLLTWYAHHQRDLPWRRTRDPYGIWVSEIMLQQTRVQTVIDYWTRWMERFPTVAALADAPLDDVLAQWSGLGYYRRARFLHSAAQVLQREHGGVLPSTAKALQKLPGIGRYTAGAVASIAFGEAAPIVDGNVERILARLFELDGDPKQRAQQKEFWALATALVDPNDPGAFNQAMMELGATVCTPRNPSCLLCPVRVRCAALRVGRVAELPGKVERAAPRVACSVSVVVRAEDTGALLLARRPDTGLLAGLLECPTVELPGVRPDATFSLDEDDRAAVGALLLDHVALDTEPDVALRYAGAVLHRFTHLHMTYHVVTLSLARTPALRGARSGWWTPAQLGDAALPTVTRKLLRRAGISEA